MMNNQCSYCSTRLATDGEYCPRCGRRQEQTTQTEFSYNHYNSPPIPPPPPPPPFNQINRQPKRITIGVAILVAILIAVIASSILVERAYYHLTVIATPKVDTTPNVVTPMKLVPPNDIPYPIIRGTLALDEKLDKATENLPLPTNNNCSFAQGSYHVVAPEGYYIGCSLENGPIFTNLAIEVEMRVLKGDCGGIQYRLNGATGTHYLFEICANGDYGFFSYFGKGGNDYKTLKQSHSPAIKKGNQTNKIAIVANGDQVFMFVNDIEIYWLIDSSYTSGQTGLAVDSSGVLGGPTADTELVFQNEKIWTF